MFDIDQLYTLDAHEKGAEMQLVDNTGKKIDAYITLAGADSDVFRNAWNENKIKALEGDTNITERMMVACALDWRGLGSKGKAIKFSKKKAEQLFKNAPYLIKMADNFIAERENFTKGLKKN